MLNSIYKENLFQDKTALVTGGGTGIGLRIAKELAQLGATAILASRKKENLDKAVVQIKNEGGKSFAVECNIREEESLKNAVKTSLSYTGKIDFLINNAGGQFPAPAEMINRKGWQAVIDLNLNGTFFLTQEVFNSYMQENGGAIVNITANFWNGFPMMSHTGAARAAVENLTKSLAIEWGKYGVRINGVAPGTINSSGLQSYAPEFKEHIFKQRSLNNQSCRLGTEAEVASAVLFLLSPGAAYITGETIKVDAGESIFSPLFPPSEPSNFPIFDDKK
jgi:NAD(P)-dependent dehydrogenase (short-subunit alcohol dehydrogenase family)